MLVVLICGIQDTEDHLKKEIAKDFLKKEMSKEILKKEMLKLL